MTDVLVIGYGNTLRGDDAIGWHVADRLRKNPVPGIQVIASHQLTPEMAETISTAERVIFVDAREDIAPGTIQTERVDTAQGTEAALSHQCDPWGLLQSARVLYGAAPVALLVGIGGDNFDLGDHMSAGMTQALESVTGLIEDLVADGHHPHWNAAPVENGRKGDTGHA